MPSDVALTDREANFSLINMEEIPMPVATRVMNIPGAVGGRWNGIPTTCHFATLYWLYCEEFGHPPTVDNFTNSDLSNPTGVVNQMLAHGRRLTRPMRGNITMTAGSVVVFVQNNQSGHSCIARTLNTLGGFNQPNWFTTLGVNHGYSTHHSADIEWLSRSEVSGNRDQRCRLVAVDEGIARAVVRQAAMTRLPGRAAG